MTAWVPRQVARVSGPAALRPLVRWVGPLGDLVMMRRQLLNLKGLAEADATPC